MYQPGATGSARRLGALARIDEREIRQGEREEPNHRSPSTQEPPWPGHPPRNAVEMEDLLLLRDLLDAGHDVEDDNGDGWTLLRHVIDVEADAHDQVSESLHADVTAFLLARGADPLRRSDGMNPAEEAEQRGHWLAAQMIVRTLSAGLMATFARRGSRSNRPR